MNRFIQARTEEVKYHEDFYAHHILFEPGSWLSKPVKIVLDMLDELDLDHIHVLDLGCGVGRNSIPIAQKIKPHNGRITCVDLLPMAVNQLIANSKIYDVQDLMVSEAADVEAYNIPANCYEYIVACSCLEHVSSVEAFSTVVSRMIEGTKSQGINAILMSTENLDVDIETGMVSDGIIELNMKTADTFSLLHDLYRDWDILIEKSVPQSIHERKYEKEIEFRSNWLTFVARK